MSLNNGAVITNNNNTKTNIHQPVIPSVGTAVSTVSSTAAQ